MEAAQPKARAPATHRGIMVGAGAAGVDTATTINTTMAAKAKDGTAGYAYAQHGQKVANARPGASLLLASCGKAAHRMHGPRRKNFLTM